MKKVNILAIALGVFLASCGDTAKKSEEKEMTHDEMHEAGVDHEDHDHDAMAEEAEEAETSCNSRRCKSIFCQPRRWANGDFTCED